MMISFTQFYENVRDQAVPEGLAENLVATFRSAVVNGLIEIQTNVPCFRDFHIDFYTKRDCQEHCDISIINGPRGIIRQIYAFKPGTECRKYTYARKGSQFIQCWAEKQKCVQCNPATPPTTFVYDSPYCNYVIPGQDACDVYGLTNESDTWFTCGCLGNCNHEKYFAVGPEYQLFLAPRFPCGYIIACQWDGIKRVWQDQDTVPDDNDLLNAVSKYVEAEMSAKDREWKDVSGLRNDFLLIQQQMAQRCREERRLIQTDDCATPSIDHLLPFINPLPYAETAVSMASTGHQTDADDHILVGRTLRVDQVYGSDQTGRRAEWNFPYQTITAAKNAALPGDEIIVGPGTYNENNLMKPGIHYYFEDGAKIEYTCPSPYTSTSTVLIGTGTKTFTVATGLNIHVGEPIAIGVPPNTVDPDEGGNEFASYIMFGTVTSYSGTTLVINCTLANGAGLTSSSWLVWPVAWGIFDDRVPGAAGDIWVDGFLEFTYRQPNPCNLTSNGAVRIENLASSFNFKGRKASIAAPPSFGGNTPFGLFSIKQCTSCFIDIDWVTDTFESWSNLNNLDPQMSVGGGGTSFYWGKGETHISCRRNTINYGYCIWCEEPTTATASSLYYDGQVMISELNSCLYVSQESSHDTTGYRVWVNCTEMKGAICVSVIGPVKVYVTAQKIWGTGTAISTSSELWLISEKITAGQTWVSFLESAYPRDTHITAQQYEDSANVSPGIFIICNTTAKLFIHGGYLKIGNQGFLNVLHSAGHAILEDCIIDSTAKNTATTYPITVSANGLTLKNCLLLAPAATPDCLHGTAAYTVQFIGTSIGNKSPAANGSITQKPLASLLGDATFAL